MCSHLCVYPHRLPSFSVFPMFCHHLYINWLVQLGAVPVCCEFFCVKSRLVTQQGSMTSCCNACLSCCFETEELDVFGKPHVDYKEMSDATRARAKVASINDIRYIRILSRGTFGKVYLVSDKKTGQYFAMKEVIKRKGIYLLREHNLEKEHTVMIKVQCPWTVEFLNHYESPFKHSILMEFLPGRTLLEEIILKRKLPMKQIRIYAAEMLVCIFSVHRHGYIHRDIKLSNFLLDAYNHIKLCDFGLCVKFLLPDQCLQVYPPHFNFWEEPANGVQAQWRKIRDTHVHMFNTPHGTTFYCAPEVIKFTYKNWSMYGSNGYTFTCDFWSYGVCLYYLLFGHLPFYSSDKLKIPRLIIYWQQTLKLNSKRVIPHSGIDLITKLICEDRSRLGANGFHEIACHSFFDNIRWEGLGYRRNPTEIPGPDTLELPDSSEDLECAWAEFLPFVYQRRKTEYPLSLRRRRMSSQIRTEAELSSISTLQRECYYLEVPSDTDQSSCKPANDLPDAGSKDASETETETYRGEREESSVDFEYLSIDPPRVRKVRMRVPHGGGGSPGREGRGTETLSTPSSSPSGYVTAQASLEDVKS